MAAQPSHPSSPLGEAMGETTRRVWLAVIALHKAGVDRFGPKLVRDEIKAQGGPSLQTTLITTHLKKLVAMGRVERLPQGHRRALYRIVEII